MRCPRINQNRIAGSSVLFATVALDDFDLWHVVGRPPHPAASRRSISTAVTWPSLPPTSAVTAVLIASAATVGELRGVPHYVSIGL